MTLDLITISTDLLMNLFVRRFLPPCSRPYLSQFVKQQGMAFICSYFIFSNTSLTLAQSMYAMPVLQQLDNVDPANERVIFRLCERAGHRRVSSTHTHIHIYIYL